VALPTKIWTVGSLLSWATNDFQSKNFADARLSSELLLASALKSDRVGLYLQHDKPVEESVRNVFRRLVEERRRGTPVAYLLGEKEFYSMSFTVRPGVLIPRPETELLVDEVCGWLTERRIQKPRICDVGTGSGAIAVTLKNKMPESAVTAIDISEEALGIARENATKHGVDVEFQKGDLLDEVNAKFDCVVANLPYISEEEYKSLSVEVREFEPKTALVSGNTGLELIEKLVAQVGRGNRSDAIFLEIGFGQETQVREIMNRNDFVKIKVRNDYAGVARVVSAFKGTSDGA
jgi:release factor glutamine methyltransferase